MPLVAGANGEGADAVDSLSFLGGAAPGATDTDTDTEAAVLTAVLAAVLAVTAALTAAETAEAAAARDSGSSALEVELPDSSSSVMATWPSLSPVSCGGWTGTGQMC